MYVLEYVIELMHTQVHMMATLVEEPRRKHQHMIDFANSVSSFYQVVASLQASELEWCGCARVCFPVGTRALHTCTYEPVLWNVTNVHSEATSAPFGRSPGSGSSGGSGSGSGSGGWSAAPRVGAAISGSSSSSTTTTTTTTAASCSTSGNGGRGTRTSSSSTTTTYGAGGIGQLLRFCEVLKDGLDGVVARLQFAGHGGLVFAGSAADLVQHLQSTLSDTHATRKKNT